ncbi:MAG: hypothetical protein ACK5QH_09785 [Rubrivivax sp.]
MVLLTLAGPARAQTPPSHSLPSEEAFHQALEQARPGAHRAGLRLRSDGLWLALLKARTPLLAARHGADCHIGYTRYTPGAAMGWLFPPGPASTRALWMAGLVRHEIAHCLLQGETVAAAASGDTAGHPAASGTAALAHAEAFQRAQRAEALADLAFALHVDSEPGGDTLVEQLARLRADRAHADPLHDASAALRCYLHHPQRRAEADPGLPTLLLWGARCLSAAPRRDAGPEAGP